MANNWEERMRNTPTKQLNKQQIEGVLKLVEIDKNSTIYTMGWNWF